MITIGGRAVRVGAAVAAAFAAGGLLVTAGPTFEDTDDGAGTPHAEAAAAELSAAAGNDVVDQAREQAPRPPAPRSPTPGLTPHHAQARPRAGHSLFRTACHSPPWVTAAATLMVRRVTVRGRGRVRQAGRRVPGPDPPRPAPEPAKPTAPDAVSGVWRPGRRARSAGGTWC
jgi:hypothetical protein